MIQFGVQNPGKRFYENYDDKKSLIFIQRMPLRDVSKPRSGERTNFGKSFDYNRIKVKIR
jgi:hypothetical protein